MSACLRIFKVNADRRARADVSVVHAPLAAGTAAVLVRAVVASGAVFALRCSPYSLSIG